MTLARKLWLGLASPFQDVKQFGKAKERREVKSCWEGHKGKVMSAGIQLQGADLVEPEFCSARLMTGVPRAKRAEGGCGHPKWEPCVPPLHTSPCCLPGGNNVPVLVLFSHTGTGCQQP